MPHSVWLARTIAADGTARGSNCSTRQLVLAAWRDAARPRRPGSSTATSTSVTSPIVDLVGLGARRRRRVQAPTARRRGGVGDQLQRRCVGTRMRQRLGASSDRRSRVTSSAQARPSATSIDFDAFRSARSTSDAAGESSASSPTPSSGSVDQIAAASAGIGATRRLGQLDTFGRRALGRPRGGVASASAARRPAARASTAAIAACSARGSAITRPVCVSASTHSRKLRSRDVDHREHGRRDRRALPRAAGCGSARRRRRCSPSSVRPTMRPLPFSVWKPRRTVRSASRSPGLASSTRVIARRPCRALRRLR